MSTTAAILSTIIVPLLLSGFFNFYGDRPWILYFPLIGLVLGASYIAWGAVQVPLWSKSSVGLGVGLLVGTCAGHWFIRAQQHETGIRKRLSDPLFAAELQELRELEDFLGGKGEGELWDLFDFPGLIRFNIQRAKEVMRPSRLTMEEAAKINEFFAEGKANLCNKYCTVERTAGGIKVEAFRGRLHILNLSKKHFDNLQTLAKFEASLRLPLEIRNAVGAFYKAVVENTHILLDTINDKLSEDPRNVLEEQNGDSPLFGATSGAFIDRCIRLKPKEEKIAAEARRYLKTGEYAA